VSSCRPSPDACDREGQVKGQPEAGDWIVGKWENCDKDFVRRMKFHRDGTVWYDIGKANNLEGSWQWTPDGLLELRPQPLIVKQDEPEAEGRIRVSRRPPDTVDRGEYLVVNDDRGHNGRLYVRMPPAK
jgi:hypothetical protein